MTPELAWSVRARVYDHIVATGRTPTVAEVASAAEISSVEAAAALTWLHERHALFLDQDGLSIRIANPFSGVPTSFHVEANGRSYWANCAWDALGVPAALHAGATIDATLSDDETPVRLTVVAGMLDDHGELVHFPLPFANWYDDIVQT